MLKVNIPKTIYFNFKYLPLKQALHLPIFIYRRTDLYKMKGEVIINAPATTGMLKIGPHGLGTQDTQYSRTMWEVAGSLVINGEASIGRGCRISIGKNAKLTLGNKFCITGGTAIICQKEISFGDDCLLSWDILVMDTDFHHILTESGHVINQPKAIKIGNHVWIGCRNTILKGVTIADNTIIAANSTITQSSDNKDCVIGGHGKGIKILKENVRWMH